MKENFSFIVSSMEKTDVINGPLIFKIRFLIIIPIIFFCTFSGFVFKGKRDPSRN